MKEMIDQFDYLKGRKTKKRNNHGQMHIFLFGLPVKQGTSKSLVKQCNDGGWYCNSSDIAE